jgi:riboflavin kinase/FMN adenylyltransferase
MITYFGSTSLDSRFPARTIVAIGNFDGVHLGHQEIIKRARTLAESMGCGVTCYTFSPHPTVELRPESPLRLLMTYEEKRQTLAKYQVDFCVEERFDASFAQISASDFFHEILKNRLHACGVVVGEDFAFGKKREGSLKTLQKFCEASQTELIAVSPVLIDGEPVSSSRIRKILGLGNVDLATRLLGRPFSYSGEVVHGDKRGRTIGFPTANMKCEEKFPLKPGVYATSVFWRGSHYASVTNIGTRPTFNSTELKIETYILDQTFELYGEILEVQFHFAIRDEKKFSSIDELKAQIQADTILAKAGLSSRNF